MPGRWLVAWRWLVLVIGANGAVLVLRSSFTTETDEGWTDHWRSRNRTLRFYAGDAITTTTSRMDTGRLIEHEHDERNEPRNHDDQLRRCLVIEC